MHMSPLCKLHRWAQKWDDPFLNFPLRCWNRNIFFIRLVYPNIWQVLLFWCNNTFPPPYIYKNVILENIISNLFPYIVTFGMYQIIPLKLCPSRANTYFQCKYTSLHTSVLGSVTPLKIEDQRANMDRWGLFSESWWQKKINLTSWFSSW